MVYYTIIAMLICLTYLEWSGKDNNILGDKNMEKYCYVFMATLLTLIAAVRYHSDPDWEVYVEYFNCCLLNNWKIFEPGYCFVCRLFKIIFDNYYVMQFVTATFYSYVIYKYLYKKSAKPIYTLLVFIPLCFFSVMMNIQRQAVAIAIVTLGMGFVEKRRFLLWMCTVLVAMQFHCTAIVAFPLYYTCNQNISKKRALIIFIGTIVVEIFGYSTILFFIQNIVKFKFLPTMILFKTKAYLSSSIYGKQIHYNTGMGVIITYIFRLLVIISYDARKDKYMLNFLIAIFCASIGRNFDVATRLHYYYTICGCGIVAYNLLDRVKIPSWVAVSKTSNSICCAVILSAYILFTYVAWFYGFHYRINVVGKLTKDYYIPYRMSIFKNM